MRAFLAAILMGGVFAASSAVADAALYGAIATTSTYPVVQYGYGVNARTLAAAEYVALNQCRVRTRYSCFVRIWFTGPGVCGAVARRGSRQGWGATRAASRVLACSRCVGPAAAVSSLRHVTGTRKQEGAAEAAPRKSVRLTSS